MIAASVSVSSKELWPVLEGLVFLVSSFLCLLLLLPPLLWGFLSSEGRDLMETPCLELWVSRSLSLIMSRYGSLYLFSSAVLFNSHVDVFLSTYYMLKTERGQSTRTMYILLHSLHFQATVLVVTVLLFPVSTLTPFLMSPNQTMSLSVLRKITFRI